MKIIEVISANGLCSLAFLADRTNLPKATILRICATLINRRWLAQNRSDGRYRIGPKFPRSGVAPDSVDAMIEAGKSDIVKLSEATGLGVDLAVSIGNGRVEIVDTTRHFSLHGIFPDCVGYRPSPFRSALGSAFLAALDAQQYTKYSAELGMHLTGKDHEAALTFEKKMQTIRANGYATREAGYWGRAVDYGEIPDAISVAIRAGNQIVGAINLVWLARKLSAKEVASTHLNRLNLAATAIGNKFAISEEV